MAPKLIFNVGLLFLMMLPGVIMKKCRLSTDGLGKGLSNLVLYVAQPALIFLAYLRPYDSNILKTAIEVLMFSVVAHALFALVAMLCFKKAPDAARRMLRFATIFSNAAFMGIPLIEAVMGSEATLYASIYNITFNLFLWSLGVHICTVPTDENEDGVIDESEIARVHKKSEASLKKAILHPVTLAAFLGLIFFFLPIDTYVPTIIIDALSMLKGLVAPLSMVVLGLRLADLKLKGLFTDKNMYLFLALRHIALPALVFAIMRLLILAGFAISDTALTVMMIMTSTPAASSATMFAEKYDCDAAYVSRLVAISTILSIATMPLMILLVEI